MRGTSPLTYAGALAIIHGPHHRFLRHFDRLVGAGLLLGAIVFPPVIALVDPKQELMRLMRDTFDRASDRLGSTGGRERLDLVAAAHTTLVLSALFDAMSRLIGPKFADLAVSDEEKLQIASSPGHLVTQQEWTASLLAADIPMPGPSVGFHENLARELTPRFAALANHAVAFFEGLRAWHALAVDTTVLRREVTEAAVALYQERYTRMAANVPEFFVWASIGEHAATRARLTEINGYLSAVLAGQSEAMGKLHDLLASATSAPRPDARLYRSRLALANAAALHKPLLRTGYVAEDLSLPSVTEGFVTPRFRTLVAGPGVDASQEARWESQEIRDGLDEFIAAFLTHPRSVEAPLIVLGHPGAGKSLLTDVLAARLPSESFTVIPVQLRRVNADDPVHAQIETALQDILHEQVSWGRIADEGSDIVRVVILDGFDELVQATGAVQSSYLSQVKAFQEQELHLGRAVVVIVTSRTLVVDRARIPHGCLLVKLEDFDDGQVARWLAAWNAANADSPGFRGLGMAEVLHHGALARQPLLLTMLAIYATDPDVYRLDAGGLSTAALYQRLLDSFIRRQVTDKADRPPSPDDVAGLMATQRWALSIAAYAMFNRGRQYATEEDLDRDLEALLGAPDDARSHGFGGRLGRARQTVANFFFVHVSSADESVGIGRQSYEFLHATFGEFLMADRAIRLLEGYADQREIYRGDPSSHAPPDDVLLRAILSHQPFTERRPALDFAQQLFAARGEQARQRVIAGIRRLLAAARGGSFSGSDYRPTPFDVVNRAAVFTVNLVLLACAAGDDGMTIGPRGVGDATPDHWLRSTGRLWWAVLPKDSWNRLNEVLVVDSAGMLTLDHPDGTRPRGGRSRKSMSDVIGDPGGS